MSNSWVLIFFNLLFTSAPPLLYGVLDKDVSVDALMSLPQLYKAGQNSQVAKWHNGCPVRPAAILCLFFLSSMDEYVKTLLLTP